MALAVAGVGLADVNLGTHQAIASAYAVFGQPGSSLSSASATIEYVSTSAGLGSAVDSNNISLQDRAHSKDATSYSLIETGTLPLRTNSQVSEVVVHTHDFSRRGFMPSRIHTSRKCGQRRNRARQLALPAHRPLASSALKTT